MVLHNTVLESIIALTYQTHHSQIKHGYTVTEKRTQSLANIRTSSFRHWIGLLKWNGMCRKLQLIPQPVLHVKRPSKLTEWLHIINPYVWQVLSHNIGTTLIHLDMKPVNDCMIATLGCCETSIDWEQTGFTPAHTLACSLLHHSTQQESTIHNGSEKRVSSSGSWLHETDRHGLSPKIKQ